VGCCFVWFGCLRAFSSGVQSPLERIASCSRSRRRIFIPSSSPPYPHLKLGGARFLVAILNLPFLVFQLTKLFLKCNVFLKPSRRLQLLPRKARDITRPQPRFNPWHCLAARLGGSVLHISLFSLLLGHRTPSRGFGTTNSSLTLDFASFLASAPSDIPKLFV